MYAGGTVKVNHFALNKALTGLGVGTTFFGALVRFFKSNNAVSIEFHENHTSRIDDYRKFFKKLAVE